MSRAKSKVRMVSLWIASRSSKRDDERHRERGLIVQLSRKSRSAHHVRERMDVAARRSFREKATWLAEQTRRSTKSLSSHRWATADDFSDIVAALRSESTGALVDSGATQRASLDAPSPRASKFETILSGNSPGTVGPCDAIVKPGRPGFVFRPPDASRVFPN